MVGYNCPGTTFTQSVLVRHTLNCGWEIRLTVMVRIPRKLKNDPIVEALFEVQFTSKESWRRLLLEAASRDCWKEFKTVRLPLADFPAAIRDSDPNLIFQPLWQLQAEDGKRVVKFGSRTFSYHALQTYPGWSVFEPGAFSNRIFVQHTRSIHGHAIRLSISKRFDRDTLREQPRRLEFSGATRRHTFIVSAKSKL